ncbi:MAG: MATE family efflux transporter [Paludibacteraceae bacterium]|nr:MATE family efflux transporter [Paludibacteraceae bacterium]
MAEQRSIGDSLLDRVRTGLTLTRTQKVQLVFYLSLPAIMAQISTIVMDYIDACMVGSMGANASAAIGLVSTSIWLIGGLCGSVASGFSVQVAHLVGATNNSSARSVLRQSLVMTFLFGTVLAVVGCLISSRLPFWLGCENTDIAKDASTYFFVFCLALPILQINWLCSAMLRCSGNMRVPSLLNVLMCVLDVVFNFFLIFPNRQVSFFGELFNVPGAGLGVTGAALGTVLAEVVVAFLMFYALCFQSGVMRLNQEKGSFKPTSSVLKKAVHIGLPIGVEHFVMCSAHVASTVIIAPLGPAAIAANAFGIIIESLCYMPGYGIGDAATTLIGQSLGAKRKELCSSFSRLSVALGIIVMSLLAVVMYVFVPDLMTLMSPDEEVRQLTVGALRIEAFAEPMYAAAIVAYGVFVGAGDTIFPCVLNLASIWVVRIPLAAWLVGSMGLYGFWLAMCIELCFRGVLFLVRMFYGNWMKSAHKLSAEQG